MHQRYKMNTFAHVPPGFRFHPTDEELVDYYLRKKVASRKIDLDVIREIDLYKIEPWDLQERCRIGSEDQDEWYFFSHKDKKYPTGTRTNRATTVGFWKATGRDKPIYAKNRSLDGMRKTLVYYKGRAPNGQKSDWIMHEYRLETNENGNSQEGWVVCRVFKKKIPTPQRSSIDSPIWHDERISFFQVHDPSPEKFTIPADISSYHHQYHHSYACKQEVELQQYNIFQTHPFFHLPQLMEIPKFPNFNQYCSSSSSSSPATAGSAAVHIDGSNLEDHVTDWRVFDKFVASQLSQDDGFKEEDLSVGSLDCLASTSATNSNIDQWK